MTEEHERRPRRTSRGDYVVDCSCGRRGLEFRWKQEANAAFRDHARAKSSEAQVQNPPYSRMLREGGAPRDGDWENAERALDGMGF